MINTKHKEGEEQENKEERKESARTSRREGVTTRKNDDKWQEEGR